MKRLRRQLREEVKKEKKEEKARGEGLKIVKETDDRREARFGPGCVLGSPLSCLFVSFFTSLPLHLFTSFTSSPRLERAEEAGKQG